MEESDYRQWKAWNRQGLIPGLEETEEAFKARAFFCLALEQELVKKVGADLPFDAGDQASQEILKEGTIITSDLYGIAPGWVPIFFNNYQLAPWHGGCAWIFQLDEQTPTSAFLQLRAGFRKQKSYLALYDRQELIAHELAHVGRMMYHEPQFEEILAYRSSSSCWRRWLGPIVQSSKESLLFIFILGAVLMADLALLVLDQPINAGALWGLKLAPLALIAFALMRLIYKQWLFTRCEKKLEELYANASDAAHLLYRLSDGEIRHFAHSTTGSIKAFMQEQATHSFRWQFLLGLYPLA